MCGIIDRFADAVRKCLVLICIVACAGPVMTVLGIVFLVKKNNRIPNIRLYNASVDEYRASPEGILQATTGTLAGAAFRAEARPSAVTGNLEDVVIAESTVLVAGAVDVTQLGVAPAMLSVRGEPPVPVPLAAPPKQRRLSDDVSCSCDSAQCSACSFAAMSGGCTGSNAELSGWGCSSSTSTRTTSAGKKETETTYQCSATCSYDVYLTAACFPLAVADGHWRQSSSHQSCEYPFDRLRQTYGGSRVASVGVSLMSEGDPRIALAGILKGGTSFGWTAEQQRATGIGLLAAGLTVCVCIYGSVGLLLFCVTKAVSEAAAGDGDTAGAEAGAEAQAKPPVTKTDLVDEELFGSEPVMVAAPPVHEGAEGCEAPAMYGNLVGSAPPVLEGAEACEGPVAIYGNPVASVPPVAQPLGFPPTAGEPTNPVGAAYPPLSGHPPLGAGSPPASGGPAFPPQGGGVAAL